MLHEQAQRLKIRVDGRKRGVARFHRAKRSRVDVQRGLLERSQMRLEDGERRRGPRVERVARETAPYEFCLGDVVVDASGHVQGGDDTLHEQSPWEGATGSRESVSIEAGRQAGGPAPGSARRS